MQTIDGIRPVWAEINLDNLAFNMRQIRKHTREEALVMAVVKANGYGHGSLGIIETLLENGADRLGVATLSEAIELRKANVRENILILGYTKPSQYEKLIEYQLTQTIYNYEDARLLSETAKNLGKTAYIHIKIDTGMGRLGFLPGQESIEDIIKISKLPSLVIEGIFTHFARADEKDKTYTIKQYKAFVEVIEALEDRNLYITIKHVANSASIIDLPQYNLDMVRAGIMIYGYYPSYEVNRDNIKLKKAMSLKSQISNLKIIEEGEGVSYGHIFLADRETKVATIPLGYADGFTRLFSDKGEVSINNQRAKIIGRICMDQLMIDVTHLGEVKIGDEVTIFGYIGDEPRVEELAEKIGTINYEIICMLGRRIPRIYKSQEKIVGMVDYLLD